MTIGEALAEGLQVTVVGLAIVFGVLVILMLVLMAFKAIFYKEPAKAAKTLPAAQSKALPAARKKDENKAEPAPMDEGELVAVLTAAIAAAYSTSTYHLNIRSYRRVGNASPEWNKAGLEDVINSTY